MIYDLYKQYVLSDFEEQSLAWNDRKRLHGKGKPSDEPWWVGKVALEEIVHHE